MPFKKARIASKGSKVKESGHAGMIQGIHPAKGSHGIPRVGVKGAKKAGY